MIDVDALLEVQRDSFARASPALLSSWPPERALDRERLAAFVAEHDFCVLATVTPSGRPQARPVRYAVGDGAFWVASARGARLRNLRSTPWASLVVSIGSGAEHTMLLAEGPVTIHGEPPPAVTWGGSWAAAYVELRPERLYSYARP